MTILGSGAVESAAAQPQGIVGAAILPASDPRHTPLSLLVGPQGPVVVIAPTISLSTTSTFAITKNVRLTRSFSSSSVFSLVSGRAYFKTVTFATTSAFTIQKAIAKGISFTTTSAFSVIKNIALVRSFTSASSFSLAKNIGKIVTFATTSKLWGFLTWGGMGTVTVGDMEVGSMTAADES